MASLLLLALMACPAPTPPFAAPEVAEAKPYWKDIAESRRWYLHALVAAEHNDDAEVGRALGWMRRLSGSDPVTWVVSAEIWFGMGEDCEGWNAIQSGLALDPTHPALVALQDGRPVPTCPP
jgi:hypothetical protein